MGGEGGLKAREEEADDAEEDKVEEKWTWRPITMTRRRRK